MWSILPPAVPAAVAINEDTKKLAAWLKENYIDKGRLGLASGHGFHDYK